MAREQSRRKVKVPIRKWLAELFGVHSESVSRWVALGHLTSYEPEDVRAFLAANPRLLTQDSRVRRVRKDKGVPRPAPKKRGKSATRAATPAAKPGSRRARR